MVSSGTAEPVAPKDTAGWNLTREPARSRRGQTCFSASGDKLPTLGEKQLGLVTDEGTLARATFQAAGGGGGPSAPWVGCTI